MSRRTTGRERERDRDRREERDYDDRKEPAPSRKLNDYFIKSEGISREVLQGEICRFLGADAYSRPTKYNGQDGFMITALRPFTPEMIKDLKAQSAIYEQDRILRKSRGHREGSNDYEQWSRSSNPKIGNYEDFQNRKSKEPVDDYRQGGSSGAMGYQSGMSPYPQESGHYQPMQQGGMYGGMPAGQGGQGYAPVTGYDQPGYPPGSGYPPGYSVAPNQAPTMSPAGYQQRDQGYGQGYQPYGGGGPPREQAYGGYPPGNQSYDPRGQPQPGSYYPGDPGQRGSSADAMQGVVSPGGDMYGGQSGYQRPQQQSQYGASTSSGSRDYPPSRQGDSYGQSSRRR